MECMRDSLVLRKVVKKLGISLKTALLWRHRFIEEFKFDAPKTLSGIVEADETYLQISTKEVENLKENLIREILPVKKEVFQRIKFVY